MPAKNEVVFTIRARDLTRAAFNRIRRGFASLRRAAFSLRGALVGGIFAAAIGGITRFGESITAASNRLDASTTTLQSWAIQAENVANVSRETLFNVFQRINRNAGSALRGNSRIIESFEALGISFNELADSSPDQLFLRIARAAQLANAAGRRREFASALAEVGDTEAVRLLGLLERGPGAFIRETQRLVAAGAIQTEETLRQSAELAAAQRQLVLQAQTELAETLAKSVPVFTAAVKQLNDTLTEWQALTDSDSIVQAVGRRAVDVTAPALRNPPLEGLGFTPPGASLIRTLTRVASATEETARNTRDGGRLN